MIVRNVIEGALALVVLLVLVLVGWQTTVLTNDMSNVKAAMLTRHDLMEASKAWAAGKEGNVGRGAIVPANYVTQAPEPPVAPQNTSGTAARSGEPGGNEPLKTLGDELQKVKQELATVRDDLKANIESTKDAHASPWGTLSRRTARARRLWPSAI